MYTHVISVLFSCVRFDVELTLLLLPNLFLFFFLQIRPALIRRFPFHEIEIKHREFKFLFWSNPPINSNPIIGQLVCTGFFSYLANQLANQLWSESQRGLVQLSFHLFTFVLLSIFCSGFQFFSFCLSSSASCRSLWQQINFGNL